MKECKEYENIQCKITKNNTKNLIKYNNAIKNKHKDLFYNIGERYFTSAVINYVLWIIENAKKDKIDAVCFLARDGYILKKCYDLYYQLIDCNIPESKYLYASRSVFYNSAITYKYDWTDKLLYSLPLGQNIESYRLRWNIEKKDFSLLLEEMNLSEDYIINTKADQVKIKKIYSRLRPLILDKATEKRKNLKQYWKNEKLLGKNVAFVDIGWNGTCQSCIEKIVNVENIKIKITFYFFGTLSTNKCKKINPESYKGCFFELGKPAEISTEIFSGIPIMDCFFSAPHPYILDLKKFDKNIIPIYDKVENLDNIKYMKSMQEGVINQIKQVFKNKKQINQIKKLNINPLIKLIKNPTKKEAKAISKFKSSVTYGTERYNINIIQKEKLVDILKNRKSLRKTYDNIMWKAGYKKINNFILRFFLK